MTVKRAEAANVGSLPASPLGSTYLQREYVFDESDNRTFFDDHVAGVSYHYTYKSIDDNGTTRWSDQLEEVLVSSTVGERNPANFSSFESFEHDDDGNLIARILTASGEEITFVWDDFESASVTKYRLKRVESDQNGRMQDARYDVDGLRKRKLDKSGQNSVEYGLGISTAASVPGTVSSNAPRISYIMGHMIMGAEIDGEFVFHLPDALGTVRDVVDDDGTVIKSLEFDEYGNLLSSSGSGTISPKTWIGGLSVNDDQVDSRMFNMGHRNYMGGVLGRFISRDPIGFAGDFNLYSYPTNPIDFVDPAGLDSLPPGWTMTTQPDGVNAYSNQSLYLRANISIPCQKEEDHPEPEIKIPDFGPLRPAVLRTGQVATSLAPSRILPGSTPPGYYPPNNAAFKAQLHANMKEATLVGKSDSHPGLWLDRKMVNEWDYKNSDFENFNFGACGRRLGIPLESLLDWRGMGGPNRHFLTPADRMNIRRGYNYAIK